MRSRHLHIVRRAVLAAAVVLATIGARSQSVVEGHVDLPAPEVPLAPPPRYEGTAAQPAPPDPPVAVVYLEGQFPAAGTNPAPAAVELRQQGMQFRPALLPVRVGTPVAFPNGDDFYHNVFSYSKTKRFDLGRYRKEDKPPVLVFDKPGVVKLYCEIHQHMRGTILVLDTPYFTRTATNGDYRLENLPAGRYQLVAWADERHVATKPVELVPGRTLRADFDLRQPAR
jgi:plastocyanin